MAQWIQPVYDRTQADVDYAKLKISQWSNDYYSADAPFVSDLKGCMNVRDLNRIEGNMEYLAERIRIAGYDIPITVRQWQTADIPTVSDLERITGNLISLIEGWYQQEKAPEAPDTILTYVDANAIEENQFLIRQLLDGREIPIQKSGMFRSGAKRMLPISARGDDTKLFSRILGTFEAGREIYLPIEGSEKDVI